MSIKCMHKERCLIIKEKEEKIIIGILCLKILVKKFFL